MFTLTLRYARIYSSVFILFGFICIALAQPQLHLRSDLYTPWGTALIVLSFTVLLTVLALASLKIKWMIHVYIGLLNVTSFFAFLYFIGIYSPFVLLWAVILLISYVYSGVIAYVLSSLVLLLQTGLTLYIFRDSPLLSTNYLAYAVLSTAVSVCTIGVAYLMVVMIKRAQDKTKRLNESQAAEEVQLSRLNALLNSISDTVLTLNRYGRITSQNSAALSFFDTNQSLVGKSIDTVLHLKDDTMKPISVRKLSEDMHGTIIRDDISMTDSNGGTMRLSVQISPVHGKFGDDDSGSVLIIRDITRQKTLEDEKDEFISVTSHELRTPIAIAEGSLSNLLYMFEKGAKPEQLASAAVGAHDQVLYLARMINDLSTLSRAERGVGDTKEDINLNTMLQELYLRYQPEAESKSLKLNLDLDKLPTVSTSHLYLEEILQNFLTNAIKYTKEGSVTLSGKLKDGRIVCAVSDTGIGISKTDQEKVFDKFFRSEDYRTRETSGTGLGLYVVRKLADKLNTKVTVESRLNHGSTFSFILPQHAATTSKNDESTPSTTS